MFVDFNAQFILNMFIFSKLWETKIDNAKTSSKLKANHNIGYDVLNSKFSNNFKLLPHKKHARLQPKKSQIHR